MSTPQSGAVAFGATVALGGKTATPGPGEGVLVVACPVADGDLGRLCERLRRLAARQDVVDLVCDVRTLPADAGSVELLARLALAARRLGRRVRLRSASDELARLLAFAGLVEVLGSGLQPQRQAEHREHPLGVQNRVDRGDAPG